MKRFFGMIAVIFLFLMLLGSACAEDGWSALFQAACPGHAIALSDQCGHTAAAVLTDGQTQVLCLAEEKNGAWALVVSNPSALRQDAAVTSLLLDTDETLFWSYRISDSRNETCHAVRDDQHWRVVSLMGSESHENGNISEYHVSYDDGRLQYSTYLCDENENILSSQHYAPVPAAWLNDILPLECYNDAHFPKPTDNYTHSWLSHEATAMAAAELFPDAVFLGGCAEQEHISLFLQQPNGDRIVASCRFDEQDGWRLNLSTPLPECAEYGRENFSSSLVIGDLLVSIGPVDESTCGVTYLYNTAETPAGEPMFSLGKNWITCDVPNGYNHCFGDHPWGDITMMNWSDLPHTFEEAVSRMDVSRWAVVNNPDPVDRLHLRAKPQREAKSLGKYYNGTPVRVLEKKGDWVHVDIFGVTGWMMKEYLAFGSAAHHVEAAFPARMPVENGTHHYVYASPEDTGPFTNYEQTVLVLAIVEDGWYHVWSPADGMSGYVLQSDWWEGNG